jgi:hypothetical protein
MEYAGQKHYITEKNILFSEHLHLHLEGKLVTEMLTFWNIYFPHETEFAFCILPFFLVLINSNLLLNNFDNLVSIATG